MAFPLVLLRECLIILYTFSLQNYHLLPLYASLSHLLEANLGELIDPELVHTGSSSQGQFLVVHSNRVELIERAVANLVDHIIK